MPDQFIARLAARQHRVVAVAQLLAAGLTRQMIKSRVAAGRLHRIYRGVYAVGTHTISREGYWMAAVLSVGRGAVLSHASAGALWSISPRAPALVHVTVPGHGGRAKRRGIAVHRSTTLTPDEITLHRGIPVTTYERTLRDLGYGPEPTRSDLERMFVRLCRRRGLPKPEFNVSIGPYTVDALWGRERLVVEVDSWTYHRSRAAFESDRARDRELAVLGFEVLRFVDREVTGSPDKVASALAEHLYMVALRSGARAPS